MHGFATLRAAVRASSPGAGLKSGVPSRARHGSPTRQEVGSSSPAVWLADGMRRVRSAVLGVVLLGAVVAEGYNFLFWDGQSFRVVASGEAFRWEESEFPLRFRMLENDYLPPDVDITQESWTGIVRRSLQRWTDVSTSDAVLILEEPVVEADRADAGDGINTIGFTSDERFRDSWITATANWSIDAGKITQCDVRVSPYFVKNWAPQDPARLLEIVITHEIGHCLGLLHSEPHPMALWTDLPVAKDAGFLPDPVMSYSNSYGLDLPPDDTAAVSLLYPAGDFGASRGSIRGTVTFNGNPAPFAYVQSVRPGGRAAAGRPGPGVFTNAAGEFIVEGLTPGPWMLWVHPMLVTRRNAHGSRLDRAAEADALGFLDQWSWVEVQEGEILEDVAINVRSGREVSR